MPSELKPMTVDQLFQRLSDIHADVQEQFHDAWDWEDAVFCVEALKAQLAEARDTLRGWLSANGPGGWIDDLRKQLAAMTAERDEFERKGKELCQCALGGLDIKNTHEKR